MCSNIISFRLIWLKSVKNEFIKNLIFENRKKKLKFFWKIWNILRWRLLKKLEEVPKKYWRGPEDKMKMEREDDLEKGKIVCSKRRFYWGIFAAFFVLMCLFVVFGELGCFYQTLWLGLSIWPTKWETSIWAK